MIAAATVRDLDVVLAFAALALVALLLTVRDPQRADYRAWLRRQRRTARLNRRFHR